MNCDCNPHCGPCQEERDKLRAEVERLKEEKVAAMTLFEGASENWKRSQCQVGIYRKALEQIFLGHHRPEAIADVALHRSIRR